MRNTLQKQRWATKLASHIPPEQFGRYLVIGSINTLVGYCSYALLTFLISPHVRFGYMLAGFIVSPLNFTFAYFNYKIFVFKTKGNHLREWIRSVLVYGGGMVGGLVFLPILVWTINFTTGLGREAPYIAGGILTLANVITSFLGHKHYSFASVADSASPRSPASSLQLNNDKPLSSEM